MYQLDLFGLQSFTRAPDHEIVGGLARLHAPPGRWLDATYGKGIMWRCAGRRPDVRLDADPKRAADVCGSYYALPFRSSSFALTVWDPPHLPATYSDSVEAGGFRARYGLESGFPDLEVARAR